jgi:hypothetical protein
MISFENGLFVGQLLGSYGMSEVYVDIISGIFLFLASIIGILVAHFSFGAKIMIGHTVTFKTEQTELVSIRSPFLRGFKVTFKIEPGLLGWQSASVGILYTGLIGLGESLEHIPQSPFISNFFHYIHILAAPIALYFFYKALWHHHKKIREPVLLPSVIMATAILFLFTGVLAGLSEMQFGYLIEESFLYITIIPTLIFFGIVVKLVVNIYEKHLIFIPTISAIALSTTLVAFFILLGRFSDFLEYPKIYLFSTAMKDILLSTTGATILIYTIGVRVMKKQLDELREQLTKQKMRKD